MSGESGKWEEFEDRKRLMTAVIWMAASIQGGFAFGQQTAVAVVLVTGFYKPSDKQSYICTYLPISLWR